MKNPENTYELKHGSKPNIKQIHTPQKQTLLHTDKFAESPRKRVRYFLAESNNASTASKYANICM